MEKHYGQIEIKEFMNMQNKQFTLVVFVIESSV